MPTYIEQIEDISKKIFDATTRIKLIRTGFVEKGKSLDSTLSAEHQTASENLRYQENLSRIANMLLWTSAVPTVELRLSSLKESDKLVYQNNLLHNLDEKLAAIGESASPHERQEIISMNQNIENLQLELAKVSEFRMREAGY